MPHNYDFYSQFATENIRDICELTGGKNHFSEIKDDYNKVELLLTSLLKDDLKIYAQIGALSRYLRQSYRTDLENQGGLKKLIHDCATYNNYIHFQHQIMQDVGLIQRHPDLNAFPKGAFFIQINFILKTSFISADDVPFYIIENPIKKDKVFKVPMLSATGWKGNLRWVMMKLFLEDKVDELSNEKFAEERLKLSLLFGTEKGIDEDNAESWSKYLKELMPSADDVYRKKLRNWFNVPSNKPMPHFKGRLRFYPTHFDKIDLMVINPHDRATKTGKNPVYIECVPGGVKGAFSLLYVPLDVIGKNDIQIDKEMKEDLKRISSATKELLLVYGFSAKRTSGFGITEPIEEQNIVVRPENEELKKIVINNICEGDNNESII